MPRGRRRWLALLLVVLLMAPAGAAGNPLEEAEALNQQAMKLYKAGRYQEALPLAQQALAIREKALGAQHPDTANSLNNLAVLYRTMGVYEKALPLYQRALKISEKVLGFQHPKTATNLNNLAALHEDMGGFSLPKAKQLSDLLLGGVAPEIKETDRVIIVPDGILGLVPFEALLIEEGRKSQDSVFVGDRYDLTYYQSAAVLALKRRLKEEPAGRPLFALGNPVFDPEDERCQPPEKKTLSPAPLVKEKNRGAFRALATTEAWGKTHRGGAQGQELIYPPLEETEGEVRAIAGLLGVKPAPPDVLLNLEANETFLKKSPLQDYRYLHFATHADLPGKVQGIKEPFILLGQVGNQAGDNGFLTLSKVLEMKLKAQMVVLSACVTGRGRVMEGEGVANFARAFQHAGARSVVVSLWEVASNEAVEFMTLFYGHLKDGKSRLETLQLARRAIKARHPQPFFWAVFILHGEG